MVSLTTNPEYIISLFVTQYERIIALAKSFVNKSVAVKLQNTLFFNDNIYVGTNESVHTVIVAIAGSTFFGKIQKEDEKGLEVLTPSGPWHVERGTYTIEINPVAKYMHKSSSMILHSELIASQKKMSPNSFLTSLQSLWFRCYTETDQSMSSPYQLCQLAIISTTLGLALIKSPQAVDQQGDEYVHQLNSITLLLDAACIRLTGPEFSGSRGNFAAANTFLLTRLGYHYLRLSNFRMVVPIARRIIATNKLIRKNYYPKITGLAAASSLLFYNLSRADSDLYIDTFDERTPAKTEVLKLYNSAMKYFSEHDHQIADSSKELVVKQLNDLQTLLRKGGLFQNA